jgi:hypothetical protein
MVRFAASSSARLAPSPQVSNFCLQISKPLFFNILQFHSNANKKVSDKQCTFVLISLVYPNSNPRPPALSPEGLAPLPPLSLLHSQDAPAFICSDVFASALSLFTLCTKSVSQLLCNQMDPHSFLKLPGVTQQFPFWNSSPRSMPRRVGSRQPGVEG